MMQRFFSTCLPASVAVAALVFVGACGEAGDQVSEADEQAITTTLETYAEALSTAYETGEFDALREVAAAKEVAAVGKRVQQMANTGRRVEAKIREIRIEEVSVWSGANAYATTFEVWDLRQLAIGSDQVLSEALERPHRVKYQLKRRPEGWRVLYRLVPETLDDAPAS